VIADVVSYAIAGIGFIHAVGRSFVPKGIIPSMNTVMTLAYHKVPHLWRFVSHFPQAASGKPQKVHSARTRVEGLMRSRLLPPPDRQGAQAPPASQHTRGLEANDSRHRTS
jgi:hypothetical protein